MKRRLTPVLALALFQLFLLTAEDAAAAFEIARPSLERLDPAVRQQIKGAREDLDNLLDNAGASSGIPKALGLMADLYVAYDLLQPALDCLAALVDLVPNEPKWHYLLGYVHERRGNIDAATAALSTSLQLQPNHAAAALRLGNIQRDQGAYARSRPLYEMALLADSNCIAANYGLGEISRREGDYDSAITRFQELLKQTPDAARPRYGLGLALRSAGQTEAAEVQLNQVNFETVSLGEWWGCADPYLSEISARTTGSAMHILRGVHAQHSGNIQLEEHEYQMAVDSNPEDPVAHKSLAATLYRKGDLEGAAEHYSITVGLRPRDAFSQYDLGQVLWRKAQPEEALEHFKRAAEINPAFLTAHRRLAEIYVTAGNLEMALPHLRRVSELDPQDVQSRARLALTLVQLNRRGEAILAIASLLDNHPPDDPEALLNLAGLLATLGALKEAEIHFQSVSQSGAPTKLRARAHEMIGQVRLAEGLPQRAIEEYNEALRLDPTSQSAREGLSRLLGANPK